MSAETVIRIGTKTFPSIIENTPFDQVEIGVAESLDPTTAAHLRESMLLLKGAKELLEANVKPGTERTPMFLFSRTTAMKAIGQSPADSKLTEIDLGFASGVIQDKLAQTKKEIKRRIFEQNKVVRH